MGTLFEQQPRWEHEAKLKIDKDRLDTFLNEASILAKKHKITITDVIAAKNALELERQNNISINDGDIKDEQLSGFGKLFRQLIETIERLITTLP